MLDAMPVLLLLGMLCVFATEDDKLDNSATTGFIEFRSPCLRQFQVVQYLQG